MTSVSTGISLPAIRSISVSLSDIYPERTILSAETGTSTLHSDTNSSPRRAFITASPGLIAVRVATGPSVFISTVWGDEFSH